jgi:hypothetical protein
MFMSTRCFLLRLVEWLPWQLYQSRYAKLPAVVDEMYCIYGSCLDQDMSRYAKPPAGVAVMYMCDAGDILMQCWRLLFCAWCIACRGRIFSFESCAAACC